MSFSYLAKKTTDDLDYETFSEGEVIHIRIKSTQMPLSLEDEKRAFMELYEHGVQIRAQFRTHDGFWGTGLRNDDKRLDYSFPQGTEYYDYNKLHNNSDPQTDPWPRMYSEAWLNNSLFAK